MENKKLLYIVLAAALVIAGLIYFSKKPQGDANMEYKTGSDTIKNAPVPKSMHTITMITNLGEIKFVTYDEDAPKAVNNFITLAEKGFYNGIIFHRVAKGFVIQGGDPLCKLNSTSSRCGAGGPGYEFEDELNPDTISYKEGYKKGVVAMANAGANTNGSQFFIMLEDKPKLVKNYTIFGKVIEGQSVVDKIGNVPLIEGTERPISPVIIESVKVESR